MLAALLSTFTWVAVLITRDGLIGDPPEVIRPFRFSMFAVSMRLPAAAMFRLLSRLMVGEMSDKLKRGVPRRLVDRSLGSTMSMFPTAWTPMEVNTKLSTNLYTLT